MVIKYTFATGINLNFVEGCFYTFDNELDLYKYIEVLYLGKSRIDGDYVFRITSNQPSGGWSYNKIQNFNVYNGAYLSTYIRNINILGEGDVCDHIVGYNDDRSYHNENLGELITFLIEYHNIDKNDLRTKDAYKNIIRNIKVDRLIND